MVEKLRQAYGDGKNPAVLAQHLRACGGVYGSCFVPAATQARMVLLSMFGNEARDGLRFVPQIFFNTFFLNYTRQELFAGKRNYVQLKLV
jgi:hypothetical protein